MGSFQTIYAFGVGFVAFYHSSVIMFALQSSFSDSFFLNPIQTGGRLFEPPLRQNRDNSYTERAMTFKFSDFS